MANTVQGAITLQAGVAVVPTGDPSWKTRRPTASLNVEHAFTGSGGGAGAAEQAYSSQQTINNGSNFDIDMAGVLANDIGETVTLNALKALIVYNRSTTGEITLTSTGPATAHVAAVNGTVTIRPGGFFALVCSEATGYAVVGGTTDTLRVANSSGAAVTVDIIVVGNVP